ncbi:MAG: hypothetical protein ABI780_06815, partial [Ardenticatenales bacterium]
SVASVYILDVSRFDHPSVLGHVEVGGAVGSSASAWMDDIGPFYAEDRRRGGVASPLSFRTVQEVLYAPPSHVRLFLDGDKLSVFDGQHGLALVDVADRMWPRVIHPFDEGLRGVDSVAFGDAILISSGLQRIHRVSVAPSSTEPQPMASFDLPDSPSFEAVAIRGAQILATRFNWLSHALSIGQYRVDGATIEGPIAITAIPGTFGRPPPTRIVVGVRGAYVAVENHGVYWAEDHGDATGSAMATTFPADTLALFLHGERALSVSRAGEVSAWDVADPVRPRFIVSTTLTHRISDAVLAWPYLVVGGPVDDELPNSRISYVDVSTTERLFADGVVDVENERITYLTGDASVTYAAGGGLTVVERVEPRDPAVTMRARYLFASGVRGLEQRGSVLSVLTFSSGGGIVRYALPLSEQPLALSSHALFGEPRGMTMLGDEGFVVANGSDGLLVLRGASAPEPKSSPTATERGDDASGRVYLPSVLKDVRPGTFHIGASTHVRSACAVPTPRPGSTGSGDVEIPSVSTSVFAGCSVTETQDVRMDGSIDKITWSTYDDRSNLTSRRSDLDGDGLAESREAWRYDEHGRLRSMDLVRANGAPASLHFDYSYDELGLLREIMQYEEGVAAGYRSYEYENGLLKRLTIGAIIGNAREQQRLETFDYDDQGRLRATNNGVICRAIIRSGERIERVSASYCRGEPIGTAQYSYDDQNRMTRSEDTRGGDWTEFDHGWYGELVETRRYRGHLEHRTVVSYGACVRPARILQLDVNFAIESRFTYAGCR